MIFEEKNKDLKILATEMKKTVQSFGWMIEQFEALIESQSMGIKNLRAQMDFPPLKPKIEEPMIIRDNTVESSSGPKIRTAVEVVSQQFGQINVQSKVLLNLNEQKYIDFYKKVYNIYEEN